MVLRVRRYVAREVLNDDRRTLDKADIFSLGASLYELAGNTRLPDSAPAAHNVIRCTIGTPISPTNAVRTCASAI